MASLNDTNVWAYTLVHAASRVRMHRLVRTDALKYLKWHMSSRYKYGMLTKSFDDVLLPPATMAFAIKYCLSLHWRKGIIINGARPLWGRYYSKKSKLTYLAKLDILNGKVR